MNSLAAIACIIVVTTSLPVPAVDQAGTAHDKTFWRGIAAQKFAMPAGESVSALVRELSGYLGSPDPELRDDISYTTLAACCLLYTSDAADE